MDFFNAKAIPPIPIKALDGFLLMTDDHTRADAAYLKGLKRIPVVWDEDTLDWEAYQICVKWCLRAGIHNIADLHSQVMNAQDYQAKWLDRCWKMQAELAKKYKEDLSFS